MGRIADEINDILVHDGVSILDGAPGRGSGRYPLGSGDEAYQRAKTTLQRINKLKKEGKSEIQIAEIMGIYDHRGKPYARGVRAEIALSNYDVRSYQVGMANHLRNDLGMSLKAVAKEMGFKNDSSVRSLLDENTEARKNACMDTALQLKKIVDEKGMIDVGAGVELDFNVSRTKFDDALYALQTRFGYPNYKGGVEQATNSGRQTTVTVLCPPGTPYKDMFKFGEVHQAYDTTVDAEGIERRKLRYPESLDSKRLTINYADTGNGAEKDGLIEIRRGVRDLELDGANYAQVRILVDGTHYLKGMAAYADDLPPGVDVRFNTNKNHDIPLKGTGDSTVLKPIKTNDPNNPFGVLLKEHRGQYDYEGADGKMHQSLINKAKSEGDWDEWSDKVPAQFLAKQPRQLAKQQLDITKANTRAEFEEIMSLTNPVLKRKMLWSFAESCDANAEKLKAAPLKGQKYKVILPVPSLKDGEVYAPTLKDGTKVALIRYPHEGTFQIPILTVNNSNKEAQGRIPKTSVDAIGITKKTADKMSGADFDGDTVQLIPLSSKVQIKSRDTLPGMEGFDPQAAYPKREHMRVMSKEGTQGQMGSISNLIMDMTLKDAKPEEMARAVRHSMCVIDAAKHELDYKRSEKENRIKELKQKYQHRVDEEGNEHNSASTLLTLAKSQKSVLRRQGSPKIDPDTGELSWKTLPENELTYVNKQGKTITKMQKSTQMRETKDARTLISDYNSPMERLYADFANYNKTMANEARKAFVSTKNAKYDPNARKEYKAEYDSLVSKIKISEKNAPKERMAQMITKSRCDAIFLDNPEMTKKERKKRKQQELSQARLEVGAKREKIEITDREWKAIQSGAISSNMMEKIFKYADEDKLRERAMPKNQKGFNSSQILMMKTYLAGGYTLGDLAEKFGVSASTISRAVNS